MLSNVKYVGNSSFAPGETKELEKIERLDKIKNYINE